MSWRPFDHNFLDILWSACNDVSTYIAAAYKRYKPRHKIFYKPHRPSVPKAWLCRSWRGPAAVAVRLRFLSSNKKKVTKLYLDSTTCENKIGQHYKKHKQSCAQQQWGWGCVLSFFQKHHFHHPGHWLFKNSKSVTLRLMRVQFFKQTYQCLWSLYKDQETFIAKKCYWFSFGLAMGRTSFKRKKSQELLFA